MVTPQTLHAPHLTNVLIDGVNWQIVDTHTPGGCSLVDWCDGSFEASDGAGKAYHSRSIGSAVRDDLESVLLVEVKVAQWKAAPGVDWIEGGSGAGWRNRDNTPKVGIYTFPTDAPAAGTWLSGSQFAPLVTVLRGIEQNAFADLLDTAVQFAHKVDEETKR